MFSKEIITMEKVKKILLIQIHIYKPEDIILCLLKNKMYILIIIF